MKLSNNFLFYLLLGVVNSVIGYVVIFSLVFFGLLPEFANLTGYCVGFFLSYLLNKKYNFKITYPHRQELPRFLISMIAAYLVNLFVLMVSYRYCGVNIYIAQIIAGVFYVLVGYLMSKYFVFKGRADVQKISIA